MSSRVSAAGIRALLEKTKSQDADFRFMALNDLIPEVRRDGFSQLDPDTESQVVMQTTELLKDTNGEVKNMAVKVLGALARRLRDNMLQVVLVNLLQMVSSKEEESRDIATLGLKTVIGEISPDSGMARYLCTKVAGDLLDHAGRSSSPAELVLDCLDVLVEIFSRFWSNLKEHVPLQNTGFKTLWPLMTHQRVAVRKRATTALSLLAASSISDIFTQLCSNISMSLQEKDPEKVKTMVSLVGALGRTSSRRIGRRLPELLPRTMTALQFDNDELRESALQTMEIMLLSCPVEVTPFLTQILQSAAELIKHDPNYTGGDDSDEEMADEFDGDDDDNDDLDIEDDYSDDEDMSWKVRRAATKTIHAAIVSRPELLASMMVSVSPVLVSRFSEREETVRVEVLETFLALLQQLQRSVGLSQATEVRAQSPGVLKRKRDAIDAEEGTSPRIQLRSQLPAIMKSLLKQLISKSASTRVVSTNVCKELVLVLQGAVDSHVPAMLSALEKSLKTLGNVTSGGNASLRSDIISLLRVVFVWHHPKFYEGHLNILIPSVAAAITDKAQRDSLEALATSADLVVTLSKSEGALASHLRHVLLLYDATTTRLGRLDSDQGMKEQSIVTLGAIVSCVGDGLADKLPDCLSTLNGRLANEVTRYAAAQVVRDMAISSACSSKAFDDFFVSGIEEMSGMLRQSNRQLKVTAFETLAALLGRLSTSLPTPTAGRANTQLEALMAGELDLNLLPQILSSQAVILKLKPELLKGALDAMLPEILDLVQSPLLQGASLDAVVAYLMAITSIDPTKAPMLIQTLRELLSSGRGQQVPANVARCIGGIAKTDPSIIPDIIQSADSNLQQAKKSPGNSIVFSLLILGEVGRFQNLADRQPLVEQVYAAFDNPSEEIKGAAGFALGNMAVGNLEAFLPVIRQRMEAHDKQSLLALGALKELIAHASATQLTQLAEQVWAPLFDICRTPNQAIRNIGAECLARLTLTDPQKYLIQLQSRLNDAESTTRAAVIAAVRFTLTDATSAYNELLAPVLVEFLALLRDPSLEVRRDAMFAFNSAAHNKPRLIRDHLASLLPLLFEETHVRKELMRKVSMGPFTVTQDDGLDLRKNAFETMYTLLDTCLGQIHMSEYLGRVVAGLRDDDQVKLLCYLILVRLSDVAPAAVARSLDDISDPINESLKVKLKDGATKQDVEKSNELTRAAFRALVSLARVAAPGTAPKFEQLVREAKRGPSAALFNEVMISQQRV